MTLQFLGGVVFDIRRVCGMVCHDAAAVSKFCEIIVGADEKWWIGGRGFEVLGYLCGEHQV
jgi:hypothetical protein